MHLCPPCKVKSIVPKHVSQGCKIIDITIDLYYNDLKITGDSFIIFNKKVENLSLCHSMSKPTLQIGEETLDTHLSIARTFQNSIS